LADYLKISTPNIGCEPTKIKLFYYDTNYVTSSTTYLFFEVEENPLLISHDLTIAFQTREDLLSNDDGYYWLLFKNEIKYSYILLIILICKNIEFEEIAPIILDLDQASSNSDLQNYFKVDLKAHFNLIFQDDALITSCSKVDYKLLDNTQPALEITSYEDFKSGVAPEIESKKTDLLIRIDQSFKFGSSLLATTMSNYKVEVPLTVRVCTIIEGTIYNLKQTVENYGDIVTIDIVNDLAKTQGIDIDSCPISTAQIDQDMYHLFTLTSYQQLILHTSDVFESPAKTTITAMTLLGK